MLKEQLASTSLRRGGTFNQLWQQRTRAPDAPLDLVFHDVLLGACATAEDDDQISFGAVYLRLFCAVGNHLLAAL